MIKNYNQFNESNSDGKEKEVSKNHPELVELSNRIKELQKKYDKKVEELTKEESSQKTESYRDKMKIKVKEAKEKAEKKK